MPGIQSIAGAKPASECRADPDCDDAHADGHRQLDRRAGTASRTLICSDFDALEPIAPEWRRKLRRRFTAGVSTRTPIHARLRAPSAAQFLR
jgi:hypothetical protein